MIPGGSGEEVVIEGPVIGEGVEGHGGDGGNVRFTEIFSVRACTCFFIISILVHLGEWRRKKLGIWGRYGKTWQQG